MNSFTLTAVGNLARNPELVAKGDVSYARFCLVGNDYAGKDDEGTTREVVTSLWFVAFGPIGERIVRNSRKGDQLIVEARVRSSNWTDKQGEKQYDHSFVVQGFKFGAPGKVKREEREARREEGLHRGEELSNGRDAEAGTANATAGGNPAGVEREAGDDRSSLGASADAGTGANSGAETGGAAKANTSVNQKSGSSRSGRRVATSVA